MKSYKKTEKIIMWDKVKKYKSAGFSISWISRTLDLDRKTVASYLEMSEEAYYAFLEQGRSKKLDAYTDYVRRFVGLFPEVSAALVHDRLEEIYGKEFPSVNSKTVFNFVSNIRTVYKLPKVPIVNERLYVKLEECAYGAQCQVDFGQYLMFREGKDRIRVWFICFVLCRSRYKFIYFQDRPFTTSSAIEGHELAFKYFEGQPKELIYDQDRVFMVEENLGDLILVEAFQNYSSSMLFTATFCRAGDPESKGKVENSVKYVKHNFLPGREFVSVERLNTEVLSWLNRTGNGKIHAGTQKIPAQEWLIEKDHLLPYEQSVDKKTLRQYLVRKDNTIVYRKNFYTLPLGTYIAKKSVWVFLEEKGDKLNLYSTDNELITSHIVSAEVGKLIGNTDHRRDKSQSLEALKEKVLTMFSNADVAVAYFEKMASNKERYMRDNYNYFLRYASIPAVHLCAALQFNRDNDLDLGSKALIEIANNYFKKSLQKTPVTDIPEVTLSEDVNAILTDTVQESSIDTYQDLM